MYKYKFKYKRLDSLLAFTNFSFIPEFVYIYILEYFRFYYYKILLIYIPNIYFYYFFYLLCTEHNDIAISLYRLLSIKAELKLSVIIDNFNSAEMRALTRRSSAVTSASP